MNRILIYLAFFCGLILSLAWILTAFTDQKIPGFSSRMQTEVYQEQNGSVVISRKKKVVIDIQNLSWEK